MTRVEEGASLRRFRTGSSVVGVIFGGPLRHWLLEEFGIHCVGAALNAHQEPLGIGGSANGTLGDRIADPKEA